MFWCYNIVFTLILFDVVIMIYVVNLLLRSEKKRKDFETCENIYVLWEILEIKLLVNLKIY